MFKLYNSNLLTNKQRFTQAILIGIAATIGCSILITIIVNATNIVSSWFYLLSAYAISYVIKTFGRGVTKKFAILGAVLVIVCILLSEIFIQFGFSILLQPEYYGVAFANAFNFLRVRGPLDIMMVLFQAASVYIGYTNSTIV